MSHYKDYTAKDFALDESFQRWVLNPNEQTAHFWNALVEEYPHKRREVDEAVELVRLAGLSSDHNVNAIYLDVWEKIRTNAEASKSVRPGTEWKLVRYASVAAVFVGIFISLVYLLRTGNGNSIEYKTTYAEMKEVVLEDGTTVTLNANSSLKLSEQWIGKNDREVFLQGEAFFNVVKTSDHKTFNVKTPEGITIQVLGTEFNVNTRRESVSVYLQSGKVRLNSGSDLITLEPGERADYNKLLHKVVVSQELLSDANDKLAWKSNLYVMNDIPLSKVARDIEDNFGTKVIVKDSTLNSKRVTAKIPAHDINVLLKVLSEALEIRIEQKDNQIIMLPL
ncbi:MAG: FecR domain-containing protein [Chryseolinea sp.]